MNGTFPGGFPARESMPDSVNMDNENNGSRKKWVKSWSRAKKKTRAPLKNKAARVLRNHSNSLPPN